MKYKKNESFFVPCAAIFIFLQYMGMNQAMNQAMNQLELEKIHFSNIIN